MIKKTSWTHYRKDTGYNGGNPRRFDVNLNNKKIRSICISAEARDRNLKKLSVQINYTKGGSVTKNHDAVTPNLYIMQKIEEQVSSINILAYENSDTTTTNFQVFVEEYI